MVRNKLSKHRKGQGHYGESERHVLQRKGIKTTTVRDFKACGVSEYPTTKNQAEDKIDQLEYNISQLKDIQQRLAGCSDELKSLNNDFDDEQFRRTVIAQLDILTSKEHDWLSRGYNLDDKIEELEENIQDLKEEFNIED
jgi:chromosome segregation ATPase